ncbi:MAG: hypothetical protein U0W24_17455 [Bacteroidales bacterium]
MNSKKNILLTGLLYLWKITLFAQQLNMSSGFYQNQFINQQINQSTELIHSGLKPLNKSYLKELNIYDSLFYQPARDKIFTERGKEKWIYRKLRTEDFIKTEHNSFSLRVNPLFNFEWQKEINDNPDYFINTRGIEFKGDIGRSFSFYSSFYENQASYVDYITDEINRTLVVPGQGAVKKLENNRFDFSRAEAYVSFSFKKYLNLQFGHSKLFIGEGYRSLILSDNSFCYPFMKISLAFNKFNYVLLWSQYQSFSGAYYNYHQRKYNALGYLSWSPKSGYEFALVESIIWPGNTPDNASKFTLNYFNPIILFRTFQFGLDNEKNILLALNSRIKIYRFAQVFTQFVLDKTDNENKPQNNYAFQIGIKQFDLFHGKLKNQTFYLHGEFNFIAPYTYTWDNAQQSFSHYNQPLAHPAGSGLKEFLGIINYTYKDFSLILRAAYIINSRDTVNSNFGSDVFKSNSSIPGIVSDIGNQPGQGIKNEIVLLKSELTYLVNSATNFQFFVSINIRRMKNQLENENIKYLAFGIRTNLNNYYYDF